MGRHSCQKLETQTLAIGIKGDLSSFSGAIKRFQRRGTRWNGLLSLKEQCARRIARIKNEQIKWFITAYLSSNLFKYVTNDIFNLRRPEFTSNYAKEFDLCDDCMTDGYDESQIRCRCPDLDAAVSQLNKHFVKRRNKGNKNKNKPNKLKQFELIYRMPDEEDAYWKDGEDPMSFFLYLSPCEYHGTFDTNDTDIMDNSSYQSYRFINGQASIEEKLLFVDAMRFLGAFESEHQQPQLILSERGDIKR